MDCPRAIRFNGAFVSLGGFVSSFADRTTRGQLRCPVSVPNCLPNRAFSPNFFPCSRAGEFLHSDLCTLAVPSADQFIPKTLGQIECPGRGHALNSGLAVR